MKFFEALLEQGSLFGVLRIDGGLQKLNYFVGFRVGGILFSAFYIFCEKIVVCVL